MAKKIPGVKIEQARLAQHDEYMSDVVAQAEECQGVTRLLPTQLAELKAASEHEHQCIVRPLKSQYTQPITDKDTERDGALSRLKAAIWAATGDPTSQNTVRAAQFLWEMSGIQKVSGSMQYDEETGKISALMTLLLGDYLTYTEAAGVKPYAVQLKRLNDEMCTLLQLRDQEQGEQGRKQTAEARTATDRAYREFVYAVNSVSFTIDQGLLDVSSRMGGSAPAEGNASLGGSPRDGQEIYNPFTPFIDFMIGHIDRFNRVILNRKPSDKVEVEETVTEETDSDGETETKVREKVEEK